MIIELKDTTAADINAQLLEARRNLGPSSGLVFTMVVVADSARYSAVLEACLEAGREHPSRIIIVTKGRAKTSQLTAEIRTGEAVPGDVITLRLSGELLDHADSVVLPLLLPDSPIVTWWPHTSPDSPVDDPLGALADRRITDASGAADPLVALRTRTRHHTKGDTDLTWTRLTPWRALLAAALDQYPTRIQGATVEAARNNAPAELMAAWLATRLHVPVDVKHTRGPGITAVRLTTASGDVVVEREDGITARYAVPGQPQRSVALRRRTINELITEELRRMDADDIFEAAMAELARRKPRSSAPRRRVPHRAATPVTRTKGTKASEETLATKGAVKVPAGRRKARTASDPSLKRRARQTSENQA